LGFGRIGDLTSVETARSVVFLSIKHSLQRVAIGIATAPFYDATKCGIEHRGRDMPANEERRKRADRRVRDLGAPDEIGERRVHPERRLPTPKEAPISDADWEKYFGPLGKPPKDKN